MYIMDYSNIMNSHMNAGEEMPLDDIKQIMKNAVNLPNETFVQYRDDDGGVFRLVVKDGEISLISPQWETLYIVTIFCWGASKSDDRVCVYLEEGQSPEDAEQKAKKRLSFGDDGYSIDDHIFDISTKAANPQNIGLVYTGE